MLCNCVGFSLNAEAMEGGEVLPREGEDLDEGEDHVDEMVSFSEGPPSNTTKKAEKKATTTAAKEVHKASDTNYLRNFVQRKADGRCLAPLLFKTAKGSTPHREPWHKLWLAKNGLREPKSLKLNPANCARDCAGLGPE